MEQLPKFSSYRIRPEPVPGESLSGYCWRFYLANGVRPPVDVNIDLKHFRRRPSQTVTGSVIEKIFTNARISAMLRDEVNAARLIAYYGGPSWFLQDKSGQFCIRCLQDRNIHLRCFDLPQVTACPWHEVELVRRCPECSASLTWASIGLGWMCRCGKKLTDMDVRQATDHGLGLSRWLIAEVASTRSRRRPNEKHLSADLLEKYRALWLSSQLRARLKTAESKHFKPIELEPTRGHSWSPTRWDLRTATDPIHVIGERFTRLLISHQRATGLSLEHVHRWNLLSKQLQVKEVLGMDTSAVLTLALHTLARIREEASWERYGEF